MIANKLVLVVDDDQEIRELLEEYLTKQGFQVVTAEDGVAMKREMTISEPDLILLDIMLPGEDGFELCQHVRKTSDVPIIMLTAVSDEMDQIVGLELGADDYIAKPFSPRQLMARMKAVMRRVKSSGPQPDISQQALPKAFLFDRWRLDTASQMLQDIQTQRSYEMTNSDYALLLLFLSRPNEVLDRDTIFYATRGRDAQPSERAVDVQLSRLRQRLGDKGRQQRLIKTVRGNGYLFNADVSYETKD
ncbi:response regulator transcription factor (plasmid) [Photobacterium sp. GJ3]|uniref:response regulator n=1 Tax=Photobacterium sp. GJ3 TaxID=2829502 RepID=UPI001B8CDA88|nr:response regulator transcription factor [Photobacterium sp. GJ3]QUJ70133.1 response regulator transcription factor [Photobacterium sp. GJ3]